MDEVRMPYHIVNFWLLDLTASFLVFVSAWYGKIKRRRIQTDEVGDYVITVVKEKKVGEGEETSESLCQGSLRRLFLYTTYFVMMAASVVLFDCYPYFMIFFQHVTVIFCILITFFQWFQPRLAMFIGGTFSTLWLLSEATTFRWVLNDVIIAFFGLLVGYLHFKNFPSLQMFLWLAVVYDVCLVKNLYLGVPSLFSAGKGETNCETVFCKAFELSEAWELPTIFTFKLGPREEHVYLGAGDIIIGCMVSNFSQMFFRSSKYLSATVLTYAVAIALLSQVGDEPYPALVTIVPLCSLQLVLSAILSHKTRSLFSLKCLDSEREPEGHDMNILL